MILCSEVTIELPTVENLLGYDWPGNVQELRNLVEAISIGLHSNIISASDLPVGCRRRVIDRK